MKTIPKRCVNAKNRCIFIENDIDGFRWKRIRVDGA